MADLIRVLLVDDQPLVRAGLSRILRPRAGIEVVGECEDGGDVEEAVARLDPDVVVMDVRMKDVDGAEATRRLRAGNAGCAILILTTYDDDDVVSAAVQAGADGFQVKDAPGEDLIRAVKAVAGGGAWLDPAVAGRVMSAFRDARPAPSSREPNGLTARELEVLGLIGRGFNNSEIAAQLYIGEVTVKTHVGNILAKLGLRDRPAAIVYAHRHGLAPGERREPSS